MVLYSLSSSSIVSKVSSRVTDGREKTLASTASRMALFGLLGFGGSIVEEEIRADGCSLDMHALL